MRIRLKNNVFVRHCGDESAIACLRTGGCTVMRDARPFLEQMSRDWQEADEIVAAVARKFSCRPEDLRDDGYAVICELEAQGFSEREGWGEGTSNLSNRKENGDGASEHDMGGDTDFALSDFYSRHALLSELHLDLTDRCNERCVHCYIPKNGSAMIPTELALKVIREFRAMEGLTIYVSGGEPMLHPDFPLILCEAKRLGLNIIVMSNLTLCDEKMVAFLKEVDPQFVNVSLYSMNSGEHDAITRVPGSWAKTMASIRALRSAGVHIRLATPILQENKNAVEQLQQFASEIQVHDVFDCDIIGRMDHNCSNQGHALGAEEAEDFVRRYQELLGLVKFDEERCAPNARVCEIGDFKMNVNARGDYYPCDGGQGIVLGTAAKDALEDVWRGDKLNSLRAMKNRDFPKCMACANRPWCKVCVVRNFNETGDMFCPAPGRCALTAVQRNVMEGE